MTVLEKIKICSVNPQETIEACSGAVDTYSWDFSRNYYVPKLPGPNVEFNPDFEVVRISSKGAVAGFDHYFKDYRDGNVCVGYECHVTQFCRDFREEILSGEGRYFFLLVSPVRPAVSFSGEKQHDFTFYLVEVRHQCRRSVTVSTDLLPLIYPDVDRGIGGNSFIVVPNV
jgi:hypothetical protein